MFLRSTIRWKDGKQHRYWSVVESRRVGGKRVVQRPLLYLGEINDSQAAAWRKSIAVQYDAPVALQLALAEQHLGHADDAEQLAAAVPDDALSVPQRVVRAEMIAEIEESGDTAPCSCSCVGGVLCLLYWKRPAGSSAGRSAP